MNRSWDYMHVNRSQTHECGMGTEARQFLFWEYINGIFVAVSNTSYAKTVGGLTTTMIKKNWMNAEYRIQV